MQGQGCAPKRQDPFNADEDGWFRIHYAKDTHPCSPRESSGPAIGSFPVKFPFLHVLLSFSSSVQAEKDTISALECSKRQKGRASESPVRSGSIGRGTGGHESAAPRQKQQLEVRWRGAFRTASNSVTAISQFLLLPRFYGRKDSGVVFSIGLLGVITPLAGTKPFLFSHLLVILTV
jgi:hypothetical protein